MWYEVKTASSIIRWYMRLFGFRGWASFWRTIYLMPGSENDQALIRHEVRHLEQIERDGIIKFSIKYLWWLLRHGYWDNPYEIDARSAEHYRT